MTHTTTLKPRWKTSQNGNKYLSYYGLKIAVYPNRLRGGWSACIKPGDAPTIYLNHADHEFEIVKRTGLASYTVMFRR